MARVRSIGQWHYIDEDLERLPDECILAAARLPCIADREGRLEDRPQRISAELFPYRPRLNMDRVLDKLADIGKLTRYTVNGRRLIQLADWHYQHPHIREKPSPHLPPKSTVPSIMQSTVPSTVLGTGPETVPSTPVSDLLSLVTGSVSDLPSPDGNGHPNGETESTSTANVKGKDAWYGTPEDREAAAVQFNCPRRPNESDREWDDRLRSTIEQHMREVASKEQARQQQLRAVERMKAGGKR